MNHLLSDICCLWMLDRSKEKCCQQSYIYIYIYMVAERAQHTAIQENTCTTLTTQPENLQAAQMTTDIVVPRGH